jgi:hypothetical protein
MSYVSDVVVNKGSAIKPEGFERARTVKEIKETNKSRIGNKEAKEKCRGYKKQKRMYSLPV